MTRSRINWNFIDKTFTIVANVLLRIIPTTSGEKKAFTYYKDDAIWFFFFTNFSLEKEFFFEKKTKPTLAEGEGSVDMRSKKNSTKEIQF